MSQWAKSGSENVETYKIGGDNCNGLRGQHFGKLMQTQNSVVGTGLASQHKYIKISESG